MSDVASSPVLLGINIDHVATLREARGTRYPEPVQAALVAEQAGADGITVHLREDRRHIQDRDVELLAQTLQTRMNLEMAVTEEMVAFARRIGPAHCCLVPEKREELTTEGGLDVVANQAWIKQCCQELTQAGIDVSLFVDPQASQIQAARECGASTVEIHTGHYAEASDAATQQRELKRIEDAVKAARQAGLVVNAGHGLHYHNTQAIAAIEGINELNIGHGVIARAVITGLDEAVRAMKAIIQQS